VEQVTTEQKQDYAGHSIFTQKSVPLLLTEVFIPGLVKVLTHKKGRL
jgi:hypothetical protein